MSNRRPIAPAAITCCQQDSRHLELTFARPVDPTTAGDPANYRLDGGADVLAARPDADGRRVMVTTTALTDLRTYAVTVAGVKTRGGRSQAGGTTAVACTNGLRSWLAMDEGRGQQVLDRVSGQLLPVRGAVDWQEREGQAGLAFDGQSTYLELGRPPVEGRLTYAAWVRIPAGLGKVFPMAIVGFDRQGAADHQFRWEIKRDGTLQLCMTDEAGETCALALWPPASAPKVPADRWCHVALTRDDSAFHLFINGARIHGCSAWGRLGHPVNPVPALVGATHGVQPGTTAFPFQGLMRDLRIYDRVLSDEELRALVRAGDPTAVVWRRNPSDWLYDAGWGVCLHFCFHATPQMSAAEWNRLVDGVDVAGLAAQLAAIGVPYVLLTIGQGTGHYCAPNAVYDHHAGLTPSKCSRRDLVSDLADALSAHGIPLMVYAPADGPWADHEARRGLGLSKHWSDGKPYPWQDYRLPEFQQRWEDICRCWSLRFGRKVQGWIIDGAYHRKERYPDHQPPNLQTYAEALRAGNPEAIVSFNSGANALQVAYSPYEEFTSGELVGNLPVGEAGFYRPFCQPTMPEAHYGPLQRSIDGEQSHLWNFLGSEWGKGEPRLPNELVAGYTRHVIDHNAVITWDVPIQPEGRIAEPFAEQLRAIAAALRRPTRGATPGASGRRVTQLLVEWGYEPNRRRSAYDGCIQATQRCTILDVTPLPGDRSTRMTGPTAWVSPPARTGQRGILVTVRHGDDLIGPERAILTVRTASGSFSFLPADLYGANAALRRTLADGQAEPWKVWGACLRPHLSAPGGLDGAPILAPEFGFFVAKAEDGHSAADYAGTLASRTLKTIRTQVRERPEQTWEHAVRSVLGTVPPLPVPWERGACTVNVCICNTLQGLPAEERLEPAMRIEVPDPHLTALWQTGAWHLLRRCHRIDRDDLPKVLKAGTATPECRFVATDDPRGMWVINNHPYSFLAIESDRILWALDHLGLHQAAADGLVQVLAEDRTDGALIPKNWVNDIHQAGALLLPWVVAEHYRLSGDRAWLKRALPRLKQGLLWIIDRRRAALAGAATDEDRRRNRTGLLSPPGLQPKSTMGDGDREGGRYYYVCDAWAYQSVKLLGEVLAEVDPKLSAMVQDELDHYRRSLLPVIEESLVLSPVIRTRDGLSRSFLPQGFQDRGPLSRCAPATTDIFAHCGIFSCDEVITSAAIEAWVRSGLLSSDDPRIDGHFEVLEDCFLTDNPWLHQRKPDYQAGRDWFDHGGWGFQSGWERLADFYLARDDIPNYLRSVFNHCAADLRQDWTFGEHTLFGYMDNDKSHNVAVSLSQLRNLLVYEQHETLWLAKAVPRAWLEQGKAIRVADAPTHFGAVSYEIASAADQGRITATVSLAVRNAPGRILLRLRHPRSAPIRSVRIDGKRRTDLDRNREIIALPPHPGPVSIEVRY